MKIPRRREHEMLLLTIFFPLAVRSFTARPLTKTLTTRCRPRRRENGPCPLKLLLEPPCDSKMTELESANPADDEDDLDWFRFANIDALYSPSCDDSNGDEAVLDRLSSSTVALVGLGGVGSWAAEALCRSGVGHFVLIDLDDVCISQTTSSITSLSSNVGNLKTDVLRKRLLDIHPSIQVDIINDFVKEDDNVEDVVVNQLLRHNVKAVIDSIDESADKAAFLKACHDHGIQSIITMGSPGGRKDPTKVVCRTLDQVQGDDSLIACRDRLHSAAKNDDGTDKDKNEDLAKAILSVYSEEEPMRDQFGGECLGTASFVSGSFGFTAAARAIEGLLSSR